MEEDGGGGGDDDDDVVGGGLVAVAFWNWLYSGDSADGFAGGGSGRSYFFSSYYF